MGEKKVDPAEEDWSSAHTRWHCSGQADVGIQTRAVLSRARTAVGLPPTPGPTTRRSPPVSCYRQPDVLDDAWWMYVRVLLGIGQDGRLIQHVDRPWGAYTVLAKAEDYKVKTTEVQPGQRPSYQKHSCRSEHWFVVGRGVRDADDEAASAP
jgi:hypothetical protein